MLITEAAVTAVTNSVLAHAARMVTNLLGSGATLERFLTRRPVRVASSLALTRALGRFAEEHPGWSEAFFDETFLTGRGAPVLAEAFDPVRRPGGRALAHAWGDELGYPHDHPRVRELEGGPAGDFLEWWAAALRARPELRPVFEPLTLGKIADAAWSTSAAVETLAGELSRAILQLRRPSLDTHIDWQSEQVVRDEAPHVVGRGYVIGAVEQFATTHRGGYFRIVGAAGLGKTALAAAVAAHLDAPAYFLRESANRSRPDKCLNHLCARLIDKYELPHHDLPPRAGEDSGFFSRILEEAAATSSEPVWLVIDGLDEAARGTASANAVHLPEYLPSNVYVVVTHRPGDYLLTVAPRIANELFELSPRATHQREAVELLIRREIDRDPKLAAAIEARTAGLGVDDFVMRMTDASEGNFMYVSYVLADLTSDPAMLDLDRLPRGLSGYYEAIWRAMEDHDARDWDSVLVPLVEAIGAAAEPITVGWLETHTAQPQRALVLALRRWERFLLRENADGRETWSVVHRSFRDFLERRLGGLESTHRGIATFYLGDGAHWAEHDGYALRHLTAHLRAARLWEEAFDLVDTDEWRTQQLDRDTSGSSYLTDVTRAWQLVRERNEAAIADGQVPPAMTAEVIVAFRSAELYSQADRVPPELLVALVEAGMWTAEQAFALAERIPNLDRRGAALSALAPHLPPGRLAVALTAVRDLPTASTRAGLLAALAPHLPIGLLPLALGEAAHLPRRARAEPIVAVAARIPPGAEVSGIEDAATAALGITDPTLRARAIAALAPHVADSSRFRTAALLLQANARAQVAAAVVPQLEDGAESSVADALDALIAVPQGQLTAEPLEALAPHLTAAQISKAAAKVRKLRDPGARAASIAALAAHASERQRRGMWTTAERALREIKEPLERVEVALKVVEVLPADRADAVLRAAVRRALDVDGLVPPQSRKRTYASHYHAAALARVADRIPSDLLPTAVQIIGEVGDTKARAAALAPLAPRLPSNLLARAVAPLIERSEEEHLVAALAELAEHLEADYRRKALTRVRALDDPTLRARALTYLAPAEGQVGWREILREALGAITVATNVHVHGLLLATLVQVLPPAKRDAVVERTVGLAARAPEAEQQAEVLAAVAPFATGPAIDGILDVVAQVGPRWRFVPPAEPSKPATLPSILRTLAPALTQAQFERLLKGLPSLRDDYTRAQALSAIGDRIPQPLLKEGIAAAERLVNHYARGEALAGFAPHLPPSSLSAALTPTLARPDAERRLSALTALAPYLPDDELRRTIRAIRAMPADGRRDTLCAVAPHLTGPLRGEALEEATKLSDLADRDLVMLELKSAGALAHSAPRRSVPPARPADMLAAFAARIAAADARSDLAPNDLPTTGRGASRAARFQRVAAALDAAAPAGESELLRVVIAHRGQLRELLA